MKPPAVHLVSDRRLVPDLLARLEAALAGAPPGCVAVHLREKDLGGAALLALARALVAVCRVRRQRLLVNDRLDVALASGADGVHLPAAGVSPAEARQLLGAGSLVGVSCHTLDEVRRAREGGADYATFGPVWDTPSKRRYGAPVGLAALAEASRLGLPLVALGGVEVGRAAEAVRAGAAGVAVIRAWLEGPAPAGAVAALRAAVAHREVAP
jgi:thiamine-phosphate pyrophosphorylase